MTHDCGSNDQTRRPNSGFQVWSTLMCKRQEELGKERQWTYIANERQNFVWFKEEYISTIDMIVPAITNKNRCNETFLMSADGSFWTLGLLLTTDCLTSWWNQKLNNGCALRLKHTKSKGSEEDVPKAELSCRLNASFESDTCRMSWMSDRSLHKENFRRVLEQKIHRKRSKLRMNLNVRSSWVRRLVWVFCISLWTISSASFSMTPRSPSSPCLYPLFYLSSFSSSSSLLYSNRLARTKRPPKL